MNVNSNYCRVPANRPLNVKSHGNLELKDPKLLGVTEVFRRNEKGKVIRHYMLDEKTAGRFVHDDGLPNNMLRLHFPTPLHFENLPVTGTLNMLTGEIRVLSPYDLVFTIEEKI